MKRLVVCFMLLPCLVMAKENNAAIESVLLQNTHLIDQLALLAPMSINPYIAVFFTALFSKLGYSTDFVATHPFYDSWLILITTGILFLFTALVGTVISTNKATATINLADKYLSNQAALIINIIIMATPMLINDSPEANQIVYQAGIFNLSLNTILIITGTVYFLIVVMTVRLFIEILILLSPIPLIDTVLEVIKVALTIAFVIISILSPTTSVIISVIMFLVGLFFYRKARVLVEKTKYFFIYPILNLFRSNKSLLEHNENFSIKVYTKKAFGRIKSGRIATLHKSNGNLLLTKRKYIFFKTDEVVHFERLTLIESALSCSVVDENNNAVIALNNSYKKHRAHIAEELQLVIVTQETPIITMHKSLLLKVKNMFNSKDIALVKTDL